MSKFEFRTAAACGGPCSEDCVEVATDVPGIVVLDAWLKRLEYGPDSRGRSA